MNPEEISRRAEKERRKLENQQQPPTPKPAGKIYNAYSFHAYSRIFPGGFNFGTWVLLCIPAIVLIGLYFFSDDTGIWALYAGAFLIGVFLVRWLFDFIQKLATFNSYKNFTSSLGFQLEGWEMLGAYPKQLSYRSWSGKSTVEVILKETITREQTKLVKDALFLFNSRANGKFYEAEMGGDGRTKWDFVNGLKVLGSSDINVIGDMYTLINDHLKSVQQKYHSIVVVKVKFDPTVFNVEPPPNTD
ncbi:hypothetical protein BH11BAC7_BH11BAC7_22310 [soil metagenome]